MGLKTREDVYKSILLSIHSLTKLAGVCNKISNEPTDEVGEQLIDVVENCENKFLKVKEEIVRMVKDIDDKGEVPVIQTESGFLIQEEQ